MRNIEHLPFRMGKVFPFERISVIIFHLNVLFETIAITAMLKAHSDWMKIEKPTHNHEESFCLIRIKCMLFTIEPVGVRTLLCMHFEKHYKTFWAKTLSKFLHLNTHYTFHCLQEGIRTFEYTCKYIRKIGDFPTILLSFKSSNENKKQLKSFYTTLKHHLRFLS